MNGHIVSFEDARALDPAVTGGKGAALARLATNGLPVPGGFVVSTGVFAEHLPPFKEAISSALSGLSATDLPAIDAASRTIQEVILSWPLSESLAEAVGAAYEGLGRPQVAVRSSATAEDLPGASFAGQYDTYLNVSSAGEVLERLRQVWASLYSTPGISYRIQREIPHENVHMAVVVQRQIAAESAGVLFTLNPVTGEPHYVVNAALGLGEGVVSGVVPTDQFTVDPDTGATLSEEIAPQDIMLTVGAEGGIEEVEVALERQDMPALSADQLADLVGLGKRIVGLFGGHQDIEFAFAEGALHLLQARPVTGVAEQTPQADWRSGIDNLYGWRLDQGPLYRLEEAVLEKYMEARQKSYVEAGSAVARNSILAIVNGYAYVRPVEVDEALVDENRAKHAARHRMYTEQGTSLLNAEITPHVEEVLAELHRFRPAGASLSALLDHMKSAIDANSHVMGDLHWRQTSPERLDWPAAFHDITGVPPTDGFVLVQAIPNKTTRLTRRLREIAKVVQTDAAVQAIFREEAFSRLDASEMRGNAAVRVIKSRLRILLRDYGYRTGRGFGSARDFKAPTWRLDPDRVLELVATYAEQDLEELDRLDAQALKERQNAHRRISRRLANDAELLERFHRTVARAQDDARRLENHNDLMEQRTVGTMREAVYFMGSGLVRAGLLNDPDDVLHLSFEELERIAEGDDIGEVHGLVSERAAEWLRRAGLQPPVTLGDAPPPQEVRGGGAPPPSDAGRDGDVLRGVAGSRGRVTGTAHVAPQTLKPPKVARGTILVADNVGPAWTPIFPLLGGLVINAGAVTQHAATVAREYRIPAVIQTKEATSVIQEGQVVTVDGDAGIVELAPEG